MFGPVLLMLYFNKLENAAGWNFLTSGDYYVI